MKAAKAVVVFIFGVVNVFLGTFVSYKVYGYFSPEVGFSLPNLTYTNMLAINFILGVVLAKWSKALTISKIDTEIEKLLKEKGIEGQESYVTVISQTLILLFTWLVFWFYYLIIF